MQKRIKIAGTVTLLLVACLLVMMRVQFHRSGLVSDGIQEQSYADLDAIEDTTSHVKMALSDSVSIDADISTGEGDYGEYAIKAAGFSIEKAQELLKNLTVSDVTSQEQYDDGAFAFYTADGGYLGNNANTITFEKNEKYQSARDFIEMSETYIETKDNQEEISGLTREQCQKMVIELCRNFTGESVHILKMTVYTPERLKEMQNQLTEMEICDKDSLTDWSSYEDMYMVQASVEKDGIRVYSAMSEPSQISAVEYETEARSGMRILISSQGILAFQIENPYVVCGDKRNITIIPAKKALTTVMDDIVNNFTDEKTVIKAIYLEYVPLCVEKYGVLDTLRPYWVIVYQRDSVGWEDVMRINAETGENLAYGK